MESAAQQGLKVTLLGTGAPPPLMDRFGPSTLVEAGGEKFIFDAGRGALQRLFQLKIPFSDITGLFFTHLHSDHVVGFPDLWLIGWLRHPWGGRRVPLSVWGPKGTAEMMSHLEKAYQFDIRIRSAHYPLEGVAIQAQDISDGMIFDKGGVKVTAFEVDHGRVKPAYGYKINYGRRSVVISGDTTLNENLIRHAEGTDLLVHEVCAATEEILQTSEQTRRIIAQHTTPEQAGEVFKRSHPRLAVYTHFLLFGNATPNDILARTRAIYSGPFELGEDLMSIEVTDKPEIRKFKP